MSKRMLAFLSTVILVFTMLPSTFGTARGTQSQENGVVGVAAAENENRYRVGYSKVSADPIDVEGTFRNAYNVPVIDGAGAGDPSKPAGYFSVPLAGYGNTAARMSQGKMDENNDGVIDDRDGMRITCIAITDPTGNTVLLMALDGIRSDDSFVFQAKQAIRSATGVLPVNITITASHSHSGPDIGSGIPEQKAYDALLKSRFVEAAKLAIVDSEYANISKASIEVADMNYVRHYKITNPNGSVNYYAGDNFGGGINRTDSQQVSEPDATMHLIKFTFDDPQENAPIAFVAWRAHPKCNSTNSNAYGKAHRKYSSSDYIGAFRDYLESNHYRASFYQAAAGNINSYSSIKKATNSSRDTNPNTLVRYDAANMVNTRPVGLEQSSIYDGCQTGYLYGAELAKAALAGLNDDSVFTPVAVGEIKSREYIYEGEGQQYSDGLVAAAASFKAKFKADNGETTTVTPSNSSKYWPYQYLHTDGKYYNLNSYYHYSTVNARKTAIPSAGIQLYVVSVGPQLVFLTAPNEMYDRYDLSGSVENQDNDWDTLINGDTYGTPIFMGYTNGSQGYIPNALAYDYNKNHTRYGQGSYEANTSKFAKGSGEDIIATYAKLLNGEIQEVESVERTGWCEHCKETAVWQPFAGFLGGTTIPAGHFYMISDVKGDINFQRQIYGSVCLDMNGFTYASQSMTTGRSFVVNSGGSLNLMNTAEKESVLQGQGCDPDVSTHSADLLFKNQMGGVIKVEKNGVVNQYDGVVIKRYIFPGQSTIRGGAVYVNAGGTYNLYGGMITGGVAEERAIRKDDSGSAETQLHSGLGGNVCVLGTLNIYGGTICGGKSTTYGGNLYVTEGATVNMYSGTITDGEVVYEGTRSVGSGGNVYLATKGSFVMGEDIGQKEAPQITNGCAARHGGNIWAAGDFTMYSGTISGGNVGGNSQMTSSPLGGNMVTYGKAVLLGGSLGEYKTAGQNIYINQESSLTLGGNAQVDGYISFSNSTSKLHVQGHYTGSATIYGSSLKRGSVLGLAENASLQEGSLTFRNNTYGVAIRDNQLVLTEPASDSCQMVGADGEVTGTFTTVKEALNAYDAVSGGYLQLLLDITAPVSVNETVYLDTNGHHITVELGENGVIYGMESLTDDYTVQEDSLGTISILNGAPQYETDITINAVRYRYLALREADGGYSYHRFSLDTQNGLRPYSTEYGTALYFKPTFQADEALAAVVDFGVLVTPQDNSKEPITVSMKQSGLTLSEVMTNGQYRVIVPELMPKNKELTDGTKNLKTHDLSKLQINGQAYIGIPTESDELYCAYDETWNSISLYDAIVIADSQPVYKTLSASQKQKLNVMYKNYKTVVDSWGRDLLVNIGNINVDISDWFN